MKEVGELEVSTPSDHQIRFTRDFAASPQAVFRAHTEPELVKRWMTGPDGWHFTLCEIDLREGGEYHYRWSDGSGVEFGFRGTFREIDAPSRIVFVERFDDGRPGESLVTQVLEQVGERTRLVMTMSFRSREARDAALQSGMESGMEAGYARLEEILEGDVEEAVG